MKKNLILAMAVVAAMVSCQKEVDTVAISQTDGDAISFSAYAKTAVTRGTVKTADYFLTTNSGTDKKGIGVFAFYQPNGSGYFNTRKYATPDFMYNQLVWCQNSSSIQGNTAIAASQWTYSPVKYWPNNNGDKLSFFAYAPYNENMTWEDMGISTDAAATKLTVNFDIVDEVESQQDIMWAAPVINKGNKSAGGTVSVTDNNGNGNGTVKFEFKHILSKIRILVGVETDKTDKLPASWNAQYANTTIQIESITFDGLYTNYGYEYAINSGDLATTPTVKQSGSQKIVVEPYEDENTGKNYGKIYYNDASDYWTNGWHNYLRASSSAVGTEYVNSTDEYMFVAPQDFTTQDATVTIKYTVTTEDTNDPLNCSTITNTISKSLKEILSVSASSKFQSQYAYTLMFLIGMNDVDIDVTFSDWATATDYQVDVPKNE